jgi:hypothetical protein
LDLVAEVGAVKTWLLEIAYVARVQVAFTLFAHVVRFMVGHDDVRVAEGERCGSPWRVLQSEI